MTGEGFRSKWFSKCGPLGSWRGHHLPSHPRPTESTLLCEILGDSEPGPGCPGEEEIVRHKRRKGHSRECSVRKPGRGSRTLRGHLVRGRQETGLSMDQTEAPGEVDQSYFRGTVGKMLSGIDGGRNKQKGNRELTAHSRSFCYRRGQRNGLLPRSRLVWGEELNFREFI